HPLDDLHLSSITVNQIAAEVASALGRGGLPAATNLATSTLGDLAAAIEQSAAGTAEQDDLAGVGAWVRAFEIRQERTSRSPVASTRATGPWSSVGCSELAAELASALEVARLGGGAVVDADAPDVVAGGTLLRACREAAALDDGVLVVVDHGFGAAGFARSFSIEHPETKVVIVTPSASAPPSTEELTAHVVAEVGHGPHVVETQLAAGARTESLLAAWEGGEIRSAPMGTEDVLLVTGGGKGIIAESALTLALRWGVAVGLLGRADPDTDPELAGNLARMRNAGVRWHYARADVTDPAAVSAAVQEVRHELGSITGVAHGAGLNAPARIEDLGEDDVALTYSVKVDGFTNVMDEVRGDPLRLVVTFGSIIGRAGLDGEAHYAAANDRVRVLTEAFAEAHPKVRTRVLEWSVWAGSGMGERLGVLAALKDKGITPIGLDDGLDMLVMLLESEDAPTTTVVAGRMGRMGSVRRERRPLPLGRFLESARIDYPGVELVVESTLSRVTDHYLDDHELDGDYLFPAVMGMEAMTQAATALTGHEGPVSLREVTFARPVVVPADGTLTIRVCALTTPEGDVEVALRTSATRFVEDHFRAVVHLGREDPVTQVSRRISSATVEVDHGELYRTLFFQGPRFQRVRRYLDLGARHAVVLLSPKDTAPWFAPHLPEDLRLGSPGLRDALMHALQSCVPTAVLLPMGVDRIDAAADFGTEDVRMEAAEVSQDGDEYVYDVLATTASGKVLERWTGLRLRAVRHRRTQVWSAPMLAGHLERTCESAGVGPLSVALVKGASSDLARDTVASLAAHRDVVVSHRLDGRPEIPDAHISLSHGEERLSLAVVADTPVACDVTKVESRDSATWFSMLGPALSSLTVHVQERTQEPLDVAATRVWTALECLRKVGRHDEGLTVETHDGAMVALRAGSMTVASFVAELADDAGTHAFAVGADPASAVRGLPTTGAARHG
ncbi:MAG: SDR family NAD(P)-dependent oxidoreductase, partial [Phycicoccus sp.]